jgi:hypothetical protein
MISSRATQPPLSELPKLLTAASALTILVTQGM